MKKLYKSIIAIILSLLMLLAGGCGEDDNKNQNNNQSDAPLGLHDISFEIDKTKEFIRNGNTNYVLVVSKDADTTANLAKTEFQKFFKEATGINIPTIVDTEITEHQSTQKYISLGTTSLFNDVVEKDLLSYDSKKLTGDGVRLKTIDDNVYIVGGSSNGTVYSVYTFLQQLFNYEFYYIDCYEIDRGVTDINLPLFDITEAPDIGFRGAMLGTSRLYGTTIENNYGEDYKMSGWRLRTPHAYYRQNKGVPNYQLDTDGTYKVTTEKSTNVHNSYETFGYDKASGMNVFGEDYAEWFSNGNDICFTAGRAGAQAEKKADDLCKVAALRFMQTFMTFEAQYRGTVYYRVMNLTQEDGASNCTCEKCSANFSNYGTYSANNVLAFNKIVSYMEEILGEISANETAKATPLDLNVYRDRWGIADKYDFNLYSSIGDVDVKVEKSYNDFYRDDWAITFFAYSYGINPPTEKNASGEHVAVAPEMNLKDHVVIWLAHQNSPTYDYYAPFNNKTDYIDRQKGWSALSPAGYSVWNYATSLIDANLPYAYMAYTPEHYQSLKKTNCQQAFIETPYAAPGEDDNCGCWFKLLSYTDAKLMWNCNLDYNTLVTNFFNAMYKDGASDMYKMWDSMKEYFSVKQEGKEFGSISGSQGTRATDWELQPALEWLGLAESALEKIEYLKDIDPQAYQTARKHIISEWTSPAYICLNWYRNNITQEKQKDMREKIQEAIDYGVQLKDFLVRVS